MSLLDRFLGLFKAAPQPGVFYPPGSYANGGMIPIAGPLTFQGWPDRTGKMPRSPINDARRAMLSAWVYSDVQYVAREGSTAALRVVRRTAGSEEPQQVINHAFELLWAKPNPLTGRSAMMQLALTHLLLSGELYLYFAPLSNSLAEIWVLPSWAMRPSPSAEEFIDGYLWQANPSKPPIRIEREYVCYTRLPNPFDARRGLSPLQAAMLAVETDEGQARWNRNFFTEDNATPSSIVSLPPETNKSDFERFRAELFDMYGGTKRRTMVARGGQIDWKVIQGYQKEMEFVAGREFTRDEIDRVYGFPSGFWVANATEANQRGAKAVVIENAVWPLLTLIAEDLSAQILDVWYGEEYDAEFEDIRPRNVELELRERQANQTTWTVNELRRAQGREPLHGELWDTVPAQVALAHWQPDAPEAEAETEEPDELPQPMERQAAREDSQEDMEQATEDDAAKWQRKALKALRAGRSAAVRFESAHLDPLWVSQVAHLLEHADSAEAIKAAFAVKAIELTEAESELRDRLQRYFALTKPEIAAAIERGDAINWAAVTAGLDQALTPWLIDWALLQIGSYADALGPVFDEADSAARLADWAAAYQAQVAGMTETTKRLVDKATRRYRDTAGMTRADLEKLLEPAFGERRAALIAVTETTRASAQAAAQYQAQLADAGIAMQRINNTANDDRVCPICAPLNRKPESDWPDASGPPWHGFCRCFVTLKLVKP